MHLTPRLPRSVVAIPLLCCLCAAPPAQAQYHATISGTFSGQFTGPTTVQDTFTGSGTDTLGGAFTFTGMANADISDLFHQLLTNGTNTLDYGGGDTLTSAFSGSLDNLSALSTNHLFTGGTGVFVNNSGSAIGTGALVFTGQTSGTFTLNLVGPAVPEPGSIALCAGMGLTGSFCAARRRRRRRKQI